jgi:hypothetical protein
MGSVLVIAIDGMDKEILERHGCNEFTEMEEYGSIDNHSGIEAISTCELFASFITGETHERHGIVSMREWNNDLLDKLKNSSFGDYIFRFQTVRRFAESLPGVVKELRSKEDLQVESLFDNVSNSRCMFVPSYCPETNFRMNKGPMALLADTPIGIEEAEQEVLKDQLARREMLFEELDGPPHSFAMCHFHMVDWLQHLHGDWEIPESKTEEIYIRFNELAGEIKRQSSYDTIIFMSDHGIVEEGESEHNRNAFYSCNQELFGDETPHITDFHDEILERVETAEQIDVSV